MAEFLTVEDSLSAYGGLQGIFNYLKRAGKKLAIGEDPAEYITEDQDHLDES